MLIRLLKQECWGCLWGKISSLGKSKSNAGRTIRKINNEFRTPVTHLTIQAWGSETFLRGVSPPQALSRKGMCGGGLNRDGKWIASAISPDMTVQPSWFLR